MKYSKIIKLKIILYFTSLLLGFYLSQLAYSLVHFDTVNAITHEASEM